MIEIQIFENTDGSVTLKARHELENGEDAYFTVDTNYKQTGLNKTLTVKQHYATLDMIESVIKFRDRVLKPLT